MKPSYTFIDHTADVLFEAEAFTLSELFEQCALAVEDTQVDLSNVEQKEERTIIGKNKNVEHLLFDFLDDVLFYKDSEMLIFSKFVVEVKQEGEDYVLTCTASGETLNPDKHEQKVDVKAITMHMFEVKKEEKVWKARVLVDI